MTALTTPLSIVGLFSVLYTMFILADLSRRMGDVTKMQPYYRGFYISMGLIILAIIARVLHSSLALSPDLAPPLLQQPTFYLFTYHLPLAIAVTLSVLITWRYWNWLFEESQP